MKLLHYKIVEFKEEENNMVVEFVFDDEGKQTTIVQTLNYGTDMAYDVKETFDKEVRYVDDDGKEQTKTEKATRIVTKRKKAFDVSMPTVLDTQIKEYAQAYMAGLIAEKATKIAVSGNVKKLAGVKNTTSL